MVCLRNISIHTVHKGDDDDDDDDDNNNNNTSTMTLQSSIHIVNFEEFCLIRKFILFFINFYKVSLIKFSYYMFTCCLKTNPTYIYFPFVEVHR